jgi:hypothetical protein
VFHADLAFFRRLDDGRLAILQGPSVSQEASSCRPPRFRSLQAHSVPSWSPLPASHRAALVQSGLQKASHQRSDDIAVLVQREMPGIQEMEL